MLLQTRAGKVTLITALSLVAAVICFGILRSSGIVDNGVVELGGAFVGFIVTVVVLNRVWGEEGVEAQGKKEGSAFVYEEIIKALDLRRASPHATPQAAPLTDYYRVKRLKTSSTLQMHYATTGEPIEWRGSITHPATAKWREVGISHAGPHGEQLKHDYRVEVELGDLGVGQTTPVINSVVYYNAFKGREREWLETHLEQPTGRLTMIVLAPDDMRVLKAAAGRSLGLSELEPASADPAILQDGSVVYWSIERPTRGARYALSWHWSSRKVDADAVL